MYCLSISRCRDESLWSLNWSSLATKASASHVQHELNTNGGNGPRLRCSFLGMILFCVLSSKHNSTSLGSEATLFCLNLLAHLCRKRRGTGIWSPFLPWRPSCFMSLHRSRNKKSILPKEHLRQITAGSLEDLWGDLINTAELWKHQFASNMHTQIVLFSVYVLQMMMWSNYSFGPHHTWRKVMW